MVPGWSPGRRQGGAHLPDREAACRRKRPYPTKKQALEAKSIQEGEGSAPLEVYKCRVRGLDRERAKRHWHLARLKEEEDDG